MLWRFGSCPERDRENMWRDFGGDFSCESQVWCQNLLLIWVKSEGVEIAGAVG